MKKINIGKNAKVEIVWRESGTNYSREMSQNIAVAFAEKYGIPVSNVSVVVEKENKGNKTEEVGNEENIKTIHDPMFQQSLFTKWLDENGVEDYDLEEIIKIDSQINSLIDYDSYEKGKRYSIKWIDWSNFLSYGKDNHFDFTQLHGLVLLNGNPGNKSGKTTFAYDLIHFLLFGKTKSGKGDNLSSLFNNYLPNETELYVKGCITIDGCDYIIKRTLKRPAKVGKSGTRKATQKVEYYKVMDNGENVLLEDGENLQGSSAKETSAIIKESIGNESDFDLIISASAKDLDDLISLSEDARGKLMSRWIGLSVIEDKDAIARQKWNKEISRGRYSDVYNRESLALEIAGMEEENDAVEKEIEKREGDLKVCDANIVSYNEKKNVLLSSKRPVDESLMMIGDVNTIEVERDRILEEGKRKKNESEALKAQIAEFGEIVVDEERYKELQREKESIIVKQTSLRSEYDQLKKANADLASAEYCPTCKRKFENVNNSAIIAENEKTMASHIKQGKELLEKKESIEKEISGIEELRKKFVEKNKVELKLAAINVQIEQYRSQYTEKVNLISQLNNNKDNIKHNCEVDAQINMVNESIKTEENVKRRLMEEIAQDKVKLSGNNESIKNKKGIIVKIEEEEKIEKNWKLYLSLIGKDGIRKIVLRNTLPIINCELNNLLGDVADFRVEVSIDDNNDVDFWLVRDSVYTRLSAASGLERTQAALALRVVLGNMSRLSRPPFVLFDEILGTTQKSFYDDMKKLYDKIVSYYEFVIHICHLDLGWEDMTITVKKEDNISRIESIS